MRNASLLVHNKTHKETVYEAFTNITLLTYIYRVHFTAL